MRKITQKLYNIMFLYVFALAYTACAPAIPHVHCSEDDDCPDGYYCNLAEGKYCLPLRDTEDSGSVDATEISDSGQTDQVRTDTQVVMDSALPDSSLPDSSLPDSSLPDSSLPDSNLPDSTVPDVGPSDASLRDLVVPDASSADSQATCNLADCPVSSNDCQQAACIDGQCALVPQADGTTCSAPNTGHHGVCQDSVCLFKCYIDGTFVGPGSNEDVDNPCRICRPNISTTDFSNADNTTSCSADNLFCTADHCQAGSCEPGPDPCTGIQPYCGETVDKCRCTQSSCPNAYSCRSNGRCRRSKTINLVNNNQDGYQDTYPHGSNPAHCVLGVNDWDGDSDDGDRYDYMSLYGAEHIGALRYVVPIPHNAHIVSAKLKVNINSVATNSSNLDIYAEPVDDAAAMAGDVPNELSSKNVTTQKGHWEQNNMGIGWHTTSDFAPVVQEIVDRPGWHGGQHILLLLYNSGSLDFYQRDSGAANGAQLVLIWEIGN